MTPYRTSLALLQWHDGAETITLPRQRQDSPSRTLITQEKSTRSWPLIPGPHDPAGRLARRESFSNITARVMIGGKPRWWQFPARASLIKKH